MDVHKAKYPILDLYKTMAIKHKCHLNYTEEEKDMGLYRYIMAGKRYHEFMTENVPGPCRATLIRHLEAYTEDIQEGTI